MKVTQVYKCNNDSLKVGQGCSSHDRVKHVKMTIINNARANKVHTG